MVCLCMCVCLCVIACEGGFPTGTASHASRAGHCSDNRLGQNEELWLLS